MANRLLLVRHADMGPKYAGKYLGATDAPLPFGAAETARPLVPLVRSAAPECCYCSPMLRCIATANVVAQDLNLSVEFDPDLREVDLGLWEGLSFAEISKSWPADVARWAQFAPDFKFPGGEAVAAFLERCQRAADRLAGRPEDAVVVFTHGGVIRTMVCYLLGLEPRHYLLFNVKPATVTTLDLFEGKGVLTGLNLTAG